MSEERNKPIALTSGVDYQSGSIVSRVIHKGKGGNVTLFAFDGGQELSEHTSPFTAILQVLEGDADVTVGDSSSKVQAGELIVLPQDVPHSVSATSQFKMLLTLLTHKKV